MLRPTIKVLLLHVLMAFTMTSCTFGVDVPTLQDEMAVLQIIVDIRNFDTTVDELIHLERLATGSRWLVGIKSPPKADIPVGYSTDFWVVDQESRNALRIGEDFRQLNKPVMSPNQESIIFIRGSGYADIVCIDLGIAIVHSFRDEQVENLDLSDFSGLPTIDCSLFPWSSRFESWFSNTEPLDVVYESPYHWLNESEIELFLGRLGPIEDQIRVGKYVLNITTKKARFIEPLITDMPKN